MSVPPANLLAPSPQALDRFWQASTGTIRMMTEFSGTSGRGGNNSACTRGARALQPGTFECSLSGGASGILDRRRPCDTYISMLCATMFDRRDPGILGAVLENDELTADVIADGIHVHPRHIEIVSAFERRRPGHGRR